MGGLLYDLHFDFTLVEPLLTRLGTELADLATDWRNAQRPIVVGESGFGATPDPLNQAFVPGYTPRADSLRADAALRIDLFDEILKAGQDCAEYYAAGNYNASVQFPDFE
jgi:hypothetical protein